MPRPHVTTRCVADTHTDKRCERIVEFGTTGGHGAGGGGLISIYNHPDGTTSVHVYQADPNVQVSLTHRATSNAQPQVWRSHAPVGT